MTTLEMLDNSRNLLQMLNELKTNPIAFAAKNKYSVPQGMTDPQEITNYLVQTRQVDQQQINNVMMNPIVRLFGGR